MHGGETVPAERRMLPARLASAQPFHAADALGTAMKTQFETSSIRRKTARIAYRWLQNAALSVIGTIGACMQMD
jgi:hypothetical protein